MAHYLVMPHLEGQTLVARLEKGPLPLDQALKIATEISDALDKAHRQGIIHRDLKPANIMLTKAGSARHGSPQAKLLDFGLAKLRTTAGPISMSGMTQLATRAPETARGMILGTLQYMAPEQVEGREADTRSDIWALGAVIYEMVTGARPFKGDTPASVIGSILKDHPAAISERVGSIPLVLDRLVARCLAKDPHDRWQSAADLHQALTWVGDGSLAMSVRASGDRQSPRFAFSTLVLQRIIPWTIVALLAVALLSSWMGLRRADPPQQAVARFEFNYPPGVEITTTNSPSVAISPDGTKLAFIGGVSGLRRLYVRQLDEFDAKQIRGTERVNVGIFSPEQRLGGVRHLRASLEEGVTSGWTRHDRHH